MTAVQALGTQAFPLLPETPRVRYLHRRNCWSDAPYDNWATSQARVRSALSTATIAWKTPLAWRLARDLPATVPSAYFDEAWLSAAWFALETQTELCEELDDRAHPGVHHHLGFSAGQWAELQRRPASLPQILLKLRDALCQAGALSTRSEWPLPPGSPDWLNAVRVTAALIDPPVSAAWQKTGRTDAEHALEQGRISAWHRVVQQLALQLSARLDLAEPAALRTDSLRGERLALNAGATTFDLSRSVQYLIRNETRLCTWLETQALQRNLTKRLTTETRSHHLSVRLEAASHASGEDMLAFARDSAWNS